MKIEQTGNTGQADGKKGNIAKFGRCVAGRLGLDRTMGRLAASHCKNGEELRPDAQYTLEHVRNCADRETEGINILKREGATDRWNTYSSICYSMREVLRWSTKSSIIRYSQGTYLIIQPH